MPRLRNRATGAVVNLPEEKAERLSATEWSVLGQPGSDEGGDEKTARRRTQTAK